MPSQAGLSAQDLRRVYRLPGARGRERAEPISPRRRHRDIRSATPSITTDAHAACVGAHRGRDGGVIIVGTGSIGWAKLNGRHYRVGGWGLPVSDEGSGAWLGREALRRVLWAHDGRVGLDRPASRPVRAIPERSARHRALDLQGIAARFRLAGAACRRACQNRRSRRRSSSCRRPPPISMRWRPLLIALGVNDCRWSAALPFRWRHGFRAAPRAHLVPPAGDALGWRAAARAGHGGIDCGLTPALFFKDLAGDARYRNRNGGRTPRSARRGAPSGTRPRKPIAELVARCRRIAAAGRGHLRARQLRACGDLRQASDRAASRHSGRRGGAEYRHRLSPAAAAQGSARS